MKTKIKTIGKILFWIFGFGICGFSFYMSLFQFWLVYGWRGIVGLVLLFLMQLFVLWKESYGKK